MKTTAQKISIMQAREDGQAIEFRMRESSDHWREIPLCAVVSWNWDHNDYRIKGPDIVGCIEVAREMLSDKARPPSFAHIHMLKEVLDHFGQCKIVHVRNSDRSKQFDGVKRGRYRLVWDGD